MRPLQKALQEHELIVLRVMGEWYDLDLTGEDKAACVTALAEGLAQLDFAQEMMCLGPEEAAAVQTLVQGNGRSPVATFERIHGEVRLMGPGALEREEPWFDPISPVESLWYRGYVYRGFDETAEGMIEFYYLPDELFARLPQPEKPKVVKEKVAAPAKPTKESKAKSASPSKQIQPEPTAVANLKPVPEPNRYTPANSSAVDDLTTLLALAQRTSLRREALDLLKQLLLNPDADRRSLLLNLAREMGMLREVNGGIRPTRTAVSWLTKSREAQLRDLMDAWSSSGWNDLCHTPGLSCEGDQWRNDPILARTALLDALPQTPDWYRLGDLISQIKQTDPDFQRPDGNYDTWYVRDEAQESYLTGIENWDLVEGRLLAFLVQGPLFWLGLAETAVLGPQTLFRLTDRALEWLANAPPATKEITTPIIVQPDATILVAHNASRHHRFQVARISEPQPVALGKPYAYQITPASLKQARAEGIEPDRILTFLQEASERPLPAATKRGIERWRERGVEGKLETAVILRVREAGILETLRTNPKTRPFIDESLGDLAATVRLENWEKLREAAAQLGLLLDSTVQ
ncbi:helicase-associated domain-containing protein [Candidatus Leptofilum sp.]|uniref:helicase-associated domain-containing protein n=1 Tax=Candidatus Leptofilum sp. TaxID=3241576 RepID=UPI003B5A1906